MFRTKVTKQLNGRRREEVRALEQLCCVHDHIQEGILLNAQEDQPTYFLCYEEELLVGLAAMYQIGSDAEICGYAHPDYRRKGLLKKLVVTVIKEAEKCGVEEVRYVMQPHPSRVIEQFVSEGFFDYEYSEYFMEWRYSYELQSGGNLRIEKADEASMQELVPLLEDAFGMDEAQIQQRINGVTGEQCIYYGAWQQNRLVGAFGTLQGEDSVYVLDFAVDADYQGRGIGKEMLKGLIYAVQKQAKDSGREQMKIRIQVSSQNETAFRLYQKNGFQVISQRDYYQVNWKRSNEI